MDGITVLRRGPKATPDSKRLLGCLPDTLLLLDRRGRVLALDGAATHASPLAGLAVNSLVSDVLPDAGEALVRQARRVLTSREAHRSQLLVRDDSRADDANDRRYEVRLQLYGREQVLAVLRDVTDGGLASAGPGVDPATRLPTRDRFVGQLADCIGQAALKERSLAVLHIDVDNLSSVTDAFGRDFTDQLLGEVAARLRQCLREADRVVGIGEGGDARGAAAIGGAGFGVILNDVDRREFAADVASRARTAFLHYFNVLGQQVRLSPSVGIAMYPKDATDADSLLKAATAAVNEARMHEQNGQQFYSDTIPMRAEKRLDLGTELRWAIEHDQLDLHYQPRYRPGEPAPVAVDALLRWEHPVRGFVPLSELIPLAESTGQLQTIGNWVLRHACLQFCQWREQGYPVERISVNLARQQLSCEKLSADVLALLEELGMPGDCLELELTERMLLKVRDGHVQLARLRESGVSIILDSFGTGYSSLRELSGLPVSAVKIDRSFVSTIEDNAQSLSVCAAATALARAFGLRVMAEGIETTGQLEQLEALGCDELQGFLFSKPLQADQIAALLVAAGDATDGAIERNQRLA